MTPKEAQKALRDIIKTCGPGHSVHISVSDGETALMGWIAVTRPEYRSVVHVDADTFEEAFQRMKAMWAEYLAGIRSERIRTMALSIIRITDEAGACSEAALRLAEYTSVEIADLGEEAAAKANEMAGRGPFSIERSANSNAAGEAA